ALNPGRSQCMPEAASWGRAWPLKTGHALAVLAHDQAIVDVCHAIDIANRREHRHQLGRENRAVEPDHVTDDHDVHGAGMRDETTEGGADVIEQHAALDMSMMTRVADACLEAAQPIPKVPGGRIRKPPRVPGEV